MRLKRGLVPGSRASRSLHAFIGFWMGLGMGILSATVIPFFVAVECYKTDEVDF